MLDKADDRLGEVKCEISSGARCHKQATPGTVNRPSKTGVSRQYNVNNIVSVSPPICKPIWGVYCITLVLSFIVCFC